MNKQHHHQKMIKTKSVIFFALITIFAGIVNTKTQIKKKALQQDLLDFVDYDGVANDMIEGMDNDSSLPKDVNDNNNGSEFGDLYDNIDSVNHNDGDNYYNDNADNNHHQYNNDEDNYYYSGVLDDHEHGQQGNTIIEINIINGKPGNMPNLRVNADEPVHHDSYLKLKNLLKK